LEETARLSDAAPRRARLPAPVKRGGLMSDPILNEVAGLARRLLPLAASDAGLRSALRTLAEEILQATAAAPPAEPTDPAKEPLRPLTLGQGRPESSNRPHAPDTSSRAAAPDDDLSDLVTRCRLKADAARLAAERQREIREGTDQAGIDDPSDPELLSWADRFTDAFYWWSASDESRAAGLTRLDDLGGCYEAVASAIALVAEGGGGRKNVDRALSIVAEAQSALRQAHQALGTTDDPDQVAVYEWVRETAARQRIFVRRHLRADDLADSTTWPDLLARIDALTEADSRSRQTPARLEQVRDQQTRIRDGQGTDDDWKAIITAIDELVGEGVPPSHREIRQFLLPIVDEVTGVDDLPRGFQLVLREVDRFLATRPSLPRTEFGQGLSDEVAQAALLLKGRSVVLIGGVRRPEAQRLLKSALGIEELIWISTREHQSIKPFEPTVARPDVALVLLAIRWSSHAFGDVKQFCDRHGKLLVRLPGGYSPNQVAAQILAQCSMKLGREQADAAD
jgi:hypothetical protein